MATPGGLDSAAALLAVLLGAPSAQITLHTGERLEVAGRSGPPIGASRTDAVVGDGRVIAADGYLGGPIRGTAGVVLGAAEVDGGADRSWSESEIDALTHFCRAIADQVETARGLDSRIARLSELQTASLTARERAIAADAERQAAQERFELLAHAGASLAPALDLPTALQAALDLVVPRLVDCAIIHLIDPKDPLQMRLAAVRHPDPGAEEAVARVFGTWRAMPADVDGSGTSAGLGQPVTIDRDFLERLSATPQDLADLESLRMSAGVIVPLLARGRIVGTLALAALDDRSIDTADLTLIEQLATRMAVALDNARLFADARVARRTAESASAHMALLSEASQSLASTLDVREAVGRLARLVVPALADWSMVTLLDDDGEPRDIGRWHRDPAMRPMVNAYADVRAASSTPHAPVRRVISTGAPVIIPDVDDEVLLGALADPDARELARSLNIGSSVELPLVARGRTLGAITLLTDRGRPALAPEELATAKEVASRAAVALDNAQTFARQRRVAEELQHSMLTQPPEPDHIQIAVRYLPAAPTVEVGGDWYDAFLDRDGNTVLVIGDVMGHDIAAAAAMGQIRSLVRGIAFDRHESPSQVLARVDEAMAGLAVGALATALLARIEQSEEDAAQGVRRITWCSAGHPGPILITPDGAVQDLVTPAGMLLGVDPTAQRQDTQAVLPIGTTVALFTDGLFERRTMSLDDGLDLVRTALGELADEPLDALCDGLLTRMLPTAPEDDVALVAVRLFDQSRARPLDAGPRDVPPAFDDPDVPALGAGESAADPQLSEAVFGPDDQAPAQCRRFLEATLAREFTRRLIADSIRSDLELVATELVTNALRVAASTISVQVQCRDTSQESGEAAWVRIAVTDDGPGLPELNVAALTDTHGRGLSIIAALSTEWGFEQSGATKTVWARLAV
ncbi:MAG: putative sensor protein [Jatrophihabitantaceae bacterium]|nr:putative sensor protein [Jatrophihabitantaceae bacterium]